MATTAKGTPYVESSDLVADYPTVSLALAEHIDDFGGKVLQVVRATDVVTRATSSTSYVDANLSVTITPQKSTSAIILIYSGWGGVQSSAGMAITITDSSNNSLSGAERLNVALSNNSEIMTGLGYSTPATTSATTYKVRFRAQTASAVEIINAFNTGQLYAIEVSA